MQIPPLISLCKYGFWSHDRRHSLTESLDNRSDPLMLNLNAILSENLLRKAYRNETGRNKMERNEKSELSKAENVYFVFCETMPMTNCDVI